jgi:hypothetical protein
MMLVWIDRLKVIGSAAVTWLIATTVIVQTIVYELGDTWPVVAEAGAQILVVLAGAISVIRRVTPVDAEDRGVL